MARHRYGSRDGTHATRSQQASLSLCVLERERQLVLALPCRDLLFKLCTLRTFMNATLAWVGHLCWQSITSMSLMDGALCRLTPTILSHIGCLLVKGGRPLVRRS